MSSAISRDHLDGEEAVTIDWERLGDLLRSSTERLRLDKAHSLLDGTPVSLKGMASQGHGTYGLVIPTLARCWPDPPPDIDELLHQGWREITPPPVDPPEAT